MSTRDLGGHTTHTGRTQSCQALSTSILLQGLRGMPPAFGLREGFHGPHALPSASSCALSWHSHLLLYNSDIMRMSKGTLKQGTGPPPERQFVTPRESTSRDVPSHRQQSLTLLAPCPRSTENYPLLFRASTPVPDGSASPVRTPHSFTLDPALATQVITVAPSSCETRYTPSNPPPASSRAIREALDEEDHYFQG